MREIQTTRFGPMKINDDEIIVFPQGILGFEGQKEFVLCGPAESGAFAFLQAVNDPDLTFVVIDPNTVCPDYEVDVPDDIVRELEATRPEQLILLAIVTVREELPKSTVNLQGPIVVNLENRRARQIVLSGEEYSVRHPLFEEEVVKSA